MLQFAANPSRRWPSLVRTPQMPAIPWISRDALRILSVMAFIGFLAPALTKAKESPQPAEAQANTPPRVKRTNCTTVRYPGESITANEQGTTRIKIDLDEAGHVTSASIAISSGFGRLDAASLETAKSCQFTRLPNTGTPEAFSTFVNYDWKIQ